MTKRFHGYCCVWVDFLLFIQTLMCYISLDTDCHSKHMQFIWFVLSVRRIKGPPDSVWTLVGLESWSQWLGYWRLHRPTVSIGSYFSRLIRDNITYILHTSLYFKILTLSLGTKFHPCGKKCIHIYKLSHTKKLLLKAYFFLFTSYRYNNIFSLISMV